MCRSGSRCSNVKYWQREKRVRYSHERGEAATSGTEAERGNRSVCTFALFLSFCTSTSRPALFFVRVEPEHGPERPTLDRSHPATLHIMSSPHVRTKKSPHIGSIYHAIFKIAWKRTPLRTGVAFYTRLSLIATHWFISYDPNRHFFLFLFYIFIYVWAISWSFLCIYLFKDETSLSWVH